MIQCKHHSTGVLLLMGLFTWALGLALIGLLRTLSLFWSYWLVRFLLVGGISLLIGLTGVAQRYQPVFDHEPTTVQGYKTTGKIVRAWVSALGLLGETLVVVGSVCVLFPSVLF